MIDVLPSLCFLLNSDCVLSASTRNIYFNKVFSLYAGRQEEGYGIKQATTGNSPRPHYRRTKGTVVTVGKHLSCDSSIETRGIGDNTQAAPKPFRVL